MEYSWWQKGIVYEAYIRSFQDTNGDGVGDINGIRQRLDYLQWLGIDVIWIPPIYKSPQREFGYDTADYLSVDPLFGTMGEFEQLLEEAHSRGIRIVLDFVPNHTSSDHAWFKESKTSRDNGKSDWYIWKDPGPDGGPPNNWVSAFGGESAWEYVEARGQYYYHAFLKEQPDLNLRNPDVEKAVFDSLRFWLDKGVDGFRIDVMWHLLKDEKFRDNPPNPEYEETMPSNNKLREVYNASRPEVVDLVVRMRNVLQEYDGDRLMIGELYQSGAALVDFYGPQCSAAQMPHNQQLILVPWEAPKMRDSIEQYIGSLPEGCWPNWVLGNHDKPRVATRVGSLAQAKVAMMMLLTLRGTPTMYYGDEIGMTNVEIPKERLKDPFEALDRGKGQGRDPQRTPMQWSGMQPSGGFSTADETWLPMAGDYHSVNVEAQKQDPTSILNLTRRIIALERQEEALSVGEHRLVITDTHGPVIAYRREHETGKFLVALNLSSNPAQFELPHGYLDLKAEISTLGEPQAEQFENIVHLRPDEGLILRCLG